MPVMDGVDLLRMLRCPGGMPFAFPFAFTTNGSGVPTLRDSYGGLLTIASGGTNNRTITLTFPKWTRTLSCPYVSEQTATINFTRTIDAAAGTVVLTASADFFDGEVEGVLFGSTSTVD